MKWFHNGQIGKGVAVIFGLGIHLYFAWGMYIFGSWLGSVFFEGVSTPQTVGAVLAAMLFCGAAYGFLYKEYAKEDVGAYGRARGDTSFMDAFTEFNRYIVIAELISSMFRSYVVWTAHNNPLQSIGLLVLSMVFLRLAWALGKILHAQANKPVAVEAGRLREAAGRMIFTEGSKYLDKLDIDELRYVADGDPTPLDSVRDVRGRDRRREEDEAAARARREEEDAQKNDSFISRMLSPRSKAGRGPFWGAQTTEAARLSQNGNKSSEH